MSRIQEKVQLIRSERLTDDNCRLTLASQSIAEAAVPGQFVMIQTASGHDPLLRRPFSIHQTRNDGTFQIVFKIIGRGTSLLAHCREGEELSVLGPLGQGYRLQPDVPAILVGGGMGIAPLLFLARRLMEQQVLQAPPQVLLGARNADELLSFLNEFQALGVRVLTATDDGSHGHSGLVTDELKKLNPLSESVIYCCGPKPMMAAVATICRERALACQVSVETAMACGMGACLGCTVPLQDGSYGHACSDGPVFDAERILWTV